jgi:hypothetical protein
MQPAGYGFPLANGTGLSSEKKESRLEDVLCVLELPEYPAADAQDHRSVSVEQSSKGRLLTAGSELFHQLAVGCLGKCLSVHQPADVANDGF